MTSTPDRVRAVANWVNLSTPLGLLVAGAGRAQLRRGPNRTWIAEQCRGGLPRAGAFTIGSVVLVPGGRLDDLIRRTPRILDHEQVHATQWALLGLAAGGLLWAAMWLTELVQVLRRIG